MSVWGQRYGDDLLKLKWLLGGVLALISLWTASSLGAATQLQIYGVGAAILFSLLRPRTLPSLSPTFWKWTTAVLVTFAVADFAIAGSGFLEPLVRLVVFILLIRACAYRTRREDLQILLLSMFLLVLTGVLTVSLLFAAQVLIFTPVAVLFLFVTNLAEEQKNVLLKPEDWHGYSSRTFVRRFIAALRSRYAFAAVMGFFVLFGIAGLIFVLIPRFQLDQNIPFLQVQAKARSGFTETIQFGEVSEITEDNSVAVRLDVPSREAVPLNPYWRMLVADTYIDGRFEASYSIRDIEFLDRINSSELEYFPQFRGLVPEDSGRVRAGTWTFYMEGNVSRYLPHLGPFLSIRFPKWHQLIENQAGLNFHVDQVSASVFSYQVESMFFARELLAHEIDRTYLPGAAPIIESPDSDIIKAVEYPMTQLAVALFPIDAEILKGFVAEVSQGEALSTVEFVERSIRWLQRRHRYSLNPNYDTSVGDPLIRWMESESGGHCELFAGSLVLLCRTYGIPARVVVGFSGGVWNPVEEYFIIRNRDAHAWVEVFEEDRWQRWDPTPGAVNSLNLPEGQTFNVVQMEAGWEAWVDSLRIAWYRRIVNFDQASQEALVDVFTDAIKAMVQSMRERVKRTVESIVDGWTKIWEGSLSLRIGLVVGWLVLVFLILFRNKIGRLMRFHAMRRWIHAGPDAETVWRKRAGRLRIQFIQVTKTLGSDAAGDSLLDDLDRLRFGRKPSSLSPEETLEQARVWMKQRRRAARKRARGSGRNTVQKG